MEKELSFIKSDFSGGLNRRNDSTKIGDSEYALCVNARTRNNVVEPINSPLLQTSGLPTTGLYQGVYSAGSIVLVFVSGAAYYKDYNFPDTNFIQIVGFQMSATAPTLYAEFVPSSTVNFARSATVLPGTNKPVTLGANIAQTPQCVVVQDGVNQPWIISSAGVARQAQTYNEWKVDNREYVPIGKQMLYHSGILYVISPDGTQIYRSVTGRPLDFVIAVDAAGDKVGDATVMSHAVDYGVITCIRPLNTDPSAIFVATPYRSYMMIPDTVNTIYNEPVFTNVPLFNTGPLNQFSFIELLGDNAFITFSGMRSFNAVLQLKNEGKNAPFSLEVSPFLEGIIQNTTCAINYDDYGMFFVKTVHGDCILVFDTLQNKWSAIDKLNGITGIIQFAELKIQGIRKLYFITSAGLYEYFGSASFEQASVYVGDYTSGVPKMPHKPVELNLIYTEPVEDGVVSASIFTDALRGKTYRRSLGDVVPAQSSTRSFPFGIATSDRVRIIRIDVGRERTGWKQGAYISWAFNAKLTHASLDTIPDLNIEDRVNQPAGVVTISAILFNGQNILVDALTASAASELLAAALAALGLSGLTGITDGLPDDTSYLWFMPPVDVGFHIEILGEGLSALSYISVCGHSFAISSHSTRQLADGSVVDVAIIELSAADVAFLNSRVGDCDVSVTPADTTVAPVGLGIPVTLVKPTVGGIPAGCSTVSYMTNVIRYPDGRGGYFYVLSVNAAGDTYTALLFTQNPDGSWLFVSPLYAGNIDVATTSSNGMMGQSFTFAQNVGFQINGRTYCVLGKVPVVPVEDPCTDSYPEFINISINANTGTGSTTLTKYNDNGIDKYIGTVTLDSGGVYAPQPCSIEIVKTEPTETLNWFIRITDVSGLLCTGYTGVISVIAGCAPPAAGSYPISGDCGSGDVVLS